MNNRESESSRKGKDDRLGNIANKLASATQPGSGHIPGIAAFYCHKCNNLLLLPYDEDSVACECGEKYRWVVYADSVLTRIEQNEATMAAMRGILQECRNLLLALHPDLTTHMNDALAIAHKIEKALSTNAGAPLLERLHQLENSEKKSKAYGGLKSTNDIKKIVDNHGSNN